jgi:DNA-binding CsgD family transcriptional regulator
MKKPTASLPAGIADPQIEFFVKNGEVFFLQNGFTHPFIDIDLLTLDLVRSELDNQPKAIQALHELGIIDPVEQLEKYIYCNFGGFDGKADITNNGISRHEYWDCCYKDFCKHEGKLCHMPEGINGILTKKETEITKLIAKDLADKEIASILGISIHTVAIHRIHIEKKVGAHSKVGIATFAQDKNII